MKPSDGPSDKVFRVSFTAEVTFDALLLQFALNVRGAAQNSFMLSFTFLMR